jgi:hypothetical protein
MTSETIPGWAGIGRGEVLERILLMRSVRAMMDGLCSDQRLRWTRGWSTEGARCLLLLLLRQGANDTRRRRFIRAWLLR